MKPYVLKWSSEVAPTVMALSAPDLLDLRLFCYLLIVRAEYFRAHPRQLVCIGDVPKKLKKKDRVRIVFRRHGHAFKLECSENKKYGQREYELKFAHTPPPTRPSANENDDDNMTPPAGGSSSSGIGRGEVRAAKMRPGPRKTSHTRKLLISYKKYNKQAWGAVSGAVWTLLALSVLRMRTAVSSARKLRYGLDGRAGLLVSRIASAARRMRTRLEAQRLGGDVAMTAYGRLEPRFIGQDLGVYFTLVFDEQIPWSADLFGAANADGEQATA